MAHLTRVRARSSPHRRPHSRSHEVTRGRCSRARKLAAAPRLSLHLSEPGRRSGDQMAARAARGGCGGTTAKNAAPTTRHAHNRTSSMACLTAGRAAAEQRVAVRMAADQRRRQRQRATSRRLRLRLRLRLRTAATNAAKLMIAAPQHALGEQMGCSASHRVRVAACELGLAAAAHGWRTHGALEETGEPVFGVG